MLNLPLARVWAKLLTIPAYGIYAGVLVFATLGTYAAGGTTADLLILCGLGLLGLLMREGGIPARLPWSASSWARSPRNNCGVR